MDYTQILGIISNSGLAIFLVVWYIVKAHPDQLKAEREMSDALNKNTQVLQQLVDKMED